MLLGNPPAEVDPDIGWLLPQNRIERQKEHAKPNIDARRGQECADLHGFLPGQSPKTDHMSSKYAQKHHP